MSGIIEVIEIKEEKCIDWKIPGFFETSYDIEVHKRQIHINGKECVLFVYPRGPHGAMLEYVMVSLFMSLPQDSDITVNLLLDVEGCEKAISSKIEEGENDDGPYRIWVWLYDNSDLEDMLDDDVLRGKVIVSCEEESTTSSATEVAACQTSLMCDNVHICPDFEDFLLTGRNSDVSIEVKGQLFKVHKLILGGCSPVFAGMFEHDMEEKNKGIVKVDDCNPDTFQNFLKCLYTGKLENILQDSLMDLYKVSDKYCVSDLKKKCSELIAKELSEHTVLDVLAVADMFSDSQLKESVVQFMVKNIKKIFRTETWKKLQTENPTLAGEILTKVFED